MKKRSLLFMCSLSFMLMGCETPQFGPITIINVMSSPTALPFDPNTPSPKPSTVDSANNVPSPQPSWIESDSNVQSPSPSSNENLTVDNPNGGPLLTFRVGTTGYNATTITVKAGKRLRVRFTPGIQDQTVSSGGFSPQYSKLGVYIKVGTTNEPTPMLSNGLDGREAQSAILDFSPEISSLCAATDTSCRKEITITVYKPNYDYWCYNYGSYNHSYYCSVDHTHVYDSHPWNGTLEVQTDDTIGFINADNCFPLNSKIPFTIKNGIVAMPNRKLLAGTLPNTTLTYGQVTLGNSVTPDASGVASSTLQSAQNAEALITLSLSQPIGYDSGSTGSLGSSGLSTGSFGNGWSGLYFPSAQNVINAAGTILVNPNILQYMTNAIQTGQIPLTGTTNTLRYVDNYYQTGTSEIVTNHTTACISGLALSMDISSNGLIYLGEAYVYLNNTHSGFILKF